jgi:hypothetical protein
MKGLEGFSQITKNTGYILAKAGKQKILAPVLKQRRY